jgi:uncharacterized protein (TIGR01244 family)
MKHAILTTTIALLVAALSSCSNTQVQHKQADRAEHTAITTEKLEVYECGNITRMHTMGGVFLASQPKAEDLLQAKQGGVRTVINLRKDEEMKDFDEAQYVKDLELNYVSLPFNGAKEMTAEVIGEARDLLNTAERPILMHCKSANRVGALWLPWRVLDGGIPYEQALAEAKTVGLKSSAYEQAARQYIDRHAR